MNTQTTEQALERLTIDQSREYLVKFMEQHFTDKTFHRYIRGERDGVNLAGDFAWQLANALAAIEANASLCLADRNKRAPMSDEDLAKQLATHIDCWMEIENEDRGDIFDAVKTILASAQQVATKEWISVDERLPESETQKVIVWCHMFYAPSYIHVGVYRKGKWHFDDSRLGEVTHWMPLPAAPTTAELPQPEQKG